jgi:hypothetical protein
MNYSRISAVPMLTLGIMLAAGSVVGAQSINSSRDQSDSSRQERACSDRTLFGDYGAKLEGTVLGPNLPIPVRTLVLFRLDGHGGLISVGHAVVNGVPPAEEWGEIRECTPSIRIAPDLRKSRKLRGQSGFTSWL